MKAGDYHNPVLLNIEEYSVRKAPYSGPPPSQVDDRESQWVLGDCFNGRIDRQRETLPKLRAYVLVPCTRFSQVCVRLW
jgi:hypothetical protein